MCNYERKNVHSTQTHKHLLTDTDTDTHIKTHSRTHDTHSYTHIHTNTPTNTRTNTHTQTINVCDNGWHGIKFKIQIGGD